MLMATPEELRDERDAEIWAFLHARVPEPGLPRSYSERGGRPVNFVELGQAIADYSEWEGPWSAFTHEFFLYETASFFDLRPPACWPIEWQAVCAGAAEALCVRFGFPVPEWTEEPKYFLGEPWMPELMLQGLPVEMFARH